MGFTKNFVLLACIYACINVAYAKNKTREITQQPNKPKSDGVTTAETHSTQPPTKRITQPPPTESKHHHHHGNASESKCVGKSGCHECTKTSHCYWCEGTKKCEVYHVKKIVPRDCPDHNWKWRQCVISGLVLMILIPTAVGLFLLTCGCCIYCKCCRGKNKRHWKQTEERMRQRRIEMEQKHETKRKERQARQDAIRKKYGLLKDEDEEPLI